MALNFNPQLKLQKQDVSEKLQKEKMEMQLKLLLNALMGDLSSAKSQKDKDSIQNQIMSLIANQGEGKNVQDITGQTLENGITNKGKSAGVSSGNAVQTEHGTYYAHSKGIDKWGRDKATKKEHKNIIKDLNAEFGIKQGKFKVDPNQADWSNLAAKTDKVNIYDDKTGKLKDGGKFDKFDVIEIKSEKYGLVKIVAGGDGNLDGGDDKVIAVGNQTAANNMQAGLNKSVGTKAEQPKTETATQAKAITGAPQVTQMAQANPVLGSMVDQVQDPYSLNDSDIKNLIAAIMQLINQR